METPAGAPFSKKLHLEITKLREMTFKDKIEYIWDYYKFFIIAFIAVLILIIVMLNTWLINPAPNTILMISWNAGFATLEQAENLTLALEEQITDEKANERIIINQILLNDEDPSMVMLNHQRVIAMVTAGQIDIFILDTDVLSMYADGGFLRPLENMLAELKQINPEVYERIEENLIYTVYEVAEGITASNILGINIGKSPLLSKLGFIEQDIYFCVAVNTSNVENIKEALITIYS